MGAARTEDEKANIRKIKARRMQVASSCRIQKSLRRIKNLYARSEKRKNDHVLHLSNRSMTLVPNLVAKMTGCPA
jgi:hypothetical protein